MIRRLSQLLAITLAITAGVPAGGAKPSGVDAEVLAIVARAETLLNGLEYERGREILEASSREPVHKKASKKTQAKLWAVLGRARAELGDVVGMDEAFLRAVSLYRKVQLSKSTSPKIIAALERARANAPVDDAPEPPPGEPSEEPQSEPEREPAVEIEEDTEAEEPPGPKPREEPRRPPERRERPRPPKAPPRRARPAPSAPAGDERPWIRPKVLGKLVPGGEARIVVDSGGLPRRARIEGKLRRTRSGPFEPLPFTRSGTVAVAKVILNQPRIEYLVEAKQGRRVVARVGSELEPLVLSTVRPAPSAYEAWSSASTRPADLGATRTSTLAVAPPRDEVAGGGLSGTELGIIIGAGALVVAGVAVIALLLLTGPADCDAREGFGCTEVQILPLARF